jgi:lysozyme
MEIIKLKDILKELDLPPPMVSFDGPTKNVPIHQVKQQDKKSDIYTNKNIDFSKTSNSNPSFDDYKKHFVEYEGHKKSTYIDSMGYKTVGIGHKFEKGEPVKSTYTESEVDSFFKKDLEQAISDTKRVFHNFDTLPKEVKIKLVSLTFNMGRGGIQKFNDFRSAIANKDWKSASAELADSKWAKQTGKRARDYIQFFKNLV